MQTKPQRAVTLPLSPLARLRPSETGRLAAFVATVALAALTDGWRSALALALALVLALLLSREALALAARDRSWPVLVLFTLGLGLIVGERTLPLGPLQVSPEGLALAAQMSTRALTILLAVYTLTSSLSLSVVAGLLERIGLRGLGFAFGVAVNALPLLQSTFRDVLTALRLRGGFRKSRLRALRLLLLTTITNSVQHAESLVAAAEARGYQPGRQPALALGWGAGDRALALGLAVTAAAILFS